MPSTLVAGSADEPDKPKIPSFLADMTRQPFIQVTGKQTYSDNVRATLEGILEGAFSAQPPKPSNPGT